MMARNFWVLACALLAACDLTEPFVPPTPPPGPATYVVSGTVVDGNDLPVARAYVQVTWNRTQRRTTYTDAAGFFSFDGIVGDVDLLVTGNPSFSQSLRVQSNVTLKVQLKNAFQVRLSTLATEVSALELASAMRASTTQPPCDPGAWDAKAPCRAFSFVAPSSGVLRIKLTFTGTTEMDAMVVSVKDKLGFAYSSVVSNTEQKLSATLEAGQSYQIWVSSYYEPQAFELLATF